MKCGCLSHNGFLTGRGYEAAQQINLGFPERPRDGVDKGEPVCYLDKVGSVSGLIEIEYGEIWNDQRLDEQYRRFINGS